MSVAAIAALAIAAPASASEIRIPTAGKTTAQLDVEINAAARTVCKADTHGQKYVYELCLRDSLHHAKAQLREFAAQQGQQLAQR